MAEVPLFRGVGAFLVTKEIWDKISPESQAKIMEILRNSIEKTNMANREANQEAIELLKKQGKALLGNSTQENSWTKRCRYLMNIEKIIPTVHFQELNNR